MQQERKERIAQNEANARALNERFGLGRFICECGNSACTDLIRMPLEIYQSVRSDDRRFIVVPDHEVPEMEDVVLRRAEWNVVRKRDEVAHIVES